MVQQEPGLLEALPAEEPGICGAESPEAAGAQPAEAHDCKDGRDDRGYCVRTLRNDFTIAHNRKLYQIEESVKTKEVTVEERVNGSMFVIQNGIRLQRRGRRNQRRQCMRAGISHAPSQPTTPGKNGTAG